jgi:hypothetical protein
VHGVAVADVEVELGVEGVSSPAGWLFRVESEDTVMHRTLWSTRDLLCQGKVSRVCMSVWWVVVAGGGAA